MRGLVVLPLLGGCQLIFPKSDVAGSDGPDKHLFTRQIHITQSSGQALVDFPVSVVLQDSYLRDHAAQDGSDIRFFDDARAVELPSEVTYDGTTGALEAWVRIANLPTDPLDIQLVYGDSTERSHPATDVWSSDFVGAWHFSEASENAVDSTSHGISMGPVVSAPVSTAGRVGTGRLFNPTRKDRLCALDKTLADFPTESFSIGLWTLMSGDDLMNTEIQPIQKGSIDIGLMKDGWGLQIASNGVIGFYSDGTMEVQTGPSPPQIADVWTFWRLQFDRGTLMTLFRDGISDQSKPIDTVSGSVDTLNDPLCFGGGPNRAFMSGVLDEVRIYKGVQTPQWISVEYANIHDRAAFMTIGDEVAR